MGVSPLYKPRIPSSLKIFVRLPAEQIPLLFLSLEQYKQRILVYALLWLSKAAKGNPKLLGVVLKDPAVALFETSADIVALYT